MNDDGGIQYYQQLGQWEELIAQSRKPCYAPLRSTDEFIDFTTLGVNDEHRCDGSRAIRDR